MRRSTHAEAGPVKLTCEAAAYRPIADYGAIGDLYTVALVSVDGSIDWCCLPRLDSGSVFAALLDRRRGGRFLLTPLSPRGRSQRYVQHTNVLETALEAARGRLVITDFMPLRGPMGTQVQEARAPALHRHIRVEGEVDVGVVWAPRLDYGRQETRIERAGHAFLACAGEERLALAGLHAHTDQIEVVHGANGPWVRAVLRMRDAERALVCRAGEDTSGIDVHASRQLMDETVDAWRGWVHKQNASADRAWAAPFSEDVIRSELTLKLLTYQETGAIAAAATTSLPEVIGGVRNWDYRYSWIRDAALTAQALFALGHQAEGHAFIDWAERVSKDEGEAGWGLQIVYGLHGGLDLTEERELGHLEGYQGSSPVRIGNAASHQLQLDIYGELLSAAHEMVRLGHDLSSGVWSFLPRVADQACRRWPEPDHGIWELRTGPQPLVYSKAMVWLALDRAIRLAEEHRLEGDVATWTRNRERLRALVLTDGYDDEVGAFVQTFGARELDASSLLLPFMEMIPVMDPRMQSTIDRTLEQLTERDLVYRYRVDDGLPGQEGAFVLCTFWLVDALALSGRSDEAHRVFERVISHKNHLGLFAEQIDPSSGALLGNFPQAFSHIGLINSVLYLSQVEGRKTPIPELLGRFTR